MWFLWGLLMWFGCHYALNMCLSFSTKYKNTKDGFDLYVAMGTGVACLGATIFSFSYIDKEIAFLIGGAVGFLTGALHFNANVKSGELHKVIMQSTRAKNDDWNSKTFEEKRILIEKIMNQSMNEMRNEGIDIDKALNEAAKEINDNNKTVRLNKTTKLREGLNNIIDDLEKKFKVNLKDAEYISQVRGNFKYDLFVFKSTITNLKGDMFEKILIAYQPKNEIRYFAVEASLIGMDMLCEWVFDNHNKEISHMNYGGVATSKLDSSNQEIITGDQVLMDQIETIITTNSKPQFTSKTDGFEWSGSADEQIKRQKFVNKDVDEPKSTTDALSSLRKLIHQLSKDEKQAFQDYQIAAKQGDVDAQFGLGSCYYNGRGTMQDYEQAMYWFRNAAVNGHIDAQYNMGLCYYNSRGVIQDRKKAVYWFEKAAEKNSPEAQYNLGHCFFNGIGVEKNYEQAVYWFQKAAEQGEPNAQNNLGGCYKNGLGIPQDLKKATYWFEKAAEQDNADAQNNLAYCYSNGKGVSQDYKKAFYWFEKAANQGIVDAQLYLGHSYYSGNYVAVDYEKALYWCSQAAEQGNPIALFYAGLCYYHGKGVNQDFEKGYNYFEQAAVLGNSEAQYNTGIINYNGKNKTQDYEQSFYWFSQSAEQNYSPAHTMLGVSYFNGHGVEKDYNKAVYWLQKAANKNQKDAQYVLSVCYSNGFGVKKDEKQASFWLKKSKEFN